MKGLHEDLREAKAVIDGTQEGGELLLLTPRAHPGSARDHKGPSSFLCPARPAAETDICLISSHLSQTQCASVYNEVLERAQRRSFDRL